MNTKESISLSEAFVEDHRHLTQGLSDILQALRDDNLEEAIRMAEDLDRMAGPHMEFEEELLYPEVRKSRGSDYVSRLYREHQVALAAVKALISSKTQERLEPQLKEQILQNLKTGLDHAISCGTLLSHVTSLDHKRQDEMLTRLLDLRRIGHRWSELSPSKK
jgi:hemerythrin superfamily protein